MTDNHSSVSSWRHDVSRTLGRIEERTENTEEKLDKALEEQVRQDGRIETLEVESSNRRAVQRKMNALMAFIVMIVTFLSNIAWKIVK